MPRLVIKKLKVRRPPATVPVVRKLRKPPTVANVIKPRPKPIAERAKERAADLAAKEASRQRYRDRAGVVMESCLDNLDSLEDMAVDLTVTLPNGSVREIQGFTVTGLGGPLGTSGATITRWLKRGMLPEPFLETSRGKVYHIEEARSMVRLIGNHQYEFRQYRDDHEELKDEIFAENSRIRRGLFPTK